MLNINKVKKILHTYLGESDDLILQMCCGGTVDQFKANDTMAEASIRPKPKEWLTVNIYYITHYIV